MEDQEFTVTVTVKVTAESPQQAESLVWDVLVGNDDIVDVDSCREAIDLDSATVEAKVSIP